MSAGRLILACVAAMGVPAPADAAFMSGNTLYPNCIAQGTYCAAYVQGLIDGITTGVGPSNFCVPVGVTGLQAEDIMTKYLADHPETRLYDAGPLGFLAFTLAFPCPAKP